MVFLRGKLIGVATYLIGVRRVLFGVEVALSGVVLQLIGVTILPLLSVIPKIKILLLPILQ